MIEKIPPLLGLILLVIGVFAFVSIGLFVSGITDDKSLLELSFIGTAIIVFIIFVYKPHEK